MGKAKYNDYISKSYQDRIEVSLANISKKPTDKFQLVGVSYIPATFKCELCSHEPCLKAFKVKNLETDLVLQVGSECIHHFGFNKTNIDLAMGMAKRVQSIVRKMRRAMKNTLEGDEYKEMPKEQKRVLVVRLFMKHQALEALKGESRKSLLQKDDVLNIIKENPWIEEEENVQKKSATSSTKQKTSMAAKSKA